MSCVRSISLQYIVAYISADCATMAEDVCEGRHDDGDHDERD